MLFRLVLRELTTPLDIASESCPIALHLHYTLSTLLHPLSGDLSLSLAIFPSPHPLL
jgi:hypothetical protein